MYGSVGDANEDNLGKTHPTVSWYWKRERNTRKAKAIECFIKPLRKTWQRGGCAALNELWFAIHEEIELFQLKNHYKTCTKLLI